MSKYMYMYIYLVYNGLLIQKTRHRKTACNLPLKSVNQVHCHSTTHRKATWRKTKHQMHVAETPTFLTCRESISSKILINEMRSSQTYDYPGDWNSSINLRLD